MEAARVVEGIRCQERRRGMSGGGGVETEKSRVIGRGDRWFDYASVPGSILTPR